MKIHLSRRISIGLDVEVNGSEIWQTPSPLRHLIRFLHSNMFRTRNLLCLSHRTKKESGVCWRETMLFWWRARCSTTWSKEIAISHKLVVISLPTFASTFHLTKAVSTSLFALTSKVFSTRKVCCHTIIFIFMVSMRTFLFFSSNRTQAMVLRLPKEAYGVIKSRWQSLSFRRRERFKCCTTSGGRTPRRLAHAT